MKGVTRLLFWEHFFSGAEIIDRYLNSKGWEAWERTTFAVWLPANYQAAPLLLGKYVP